MTLEKGPDFTPCGCLAIDGVLAGVVGVGYTGDAELTLGNDSECIRVVNGIINKLKEDGDAGILETREQ